MWRCLPCAKSELRLDLTLACGQSFRYVVVAKFGYIMSVRNCLLSSLIDTYLAQDPSLNTVVNMLPYISNAKYVVLVEHSAKFDKKKNFVSLF